MKSKASLFVTAHLRENKIDSGCKPSEASVRDSEGLQPKKRPPLLFQKNAAKSLHPS